MMLNIILAILLVAACVGWGLAIWWPLIRKDRE